MKKHFVLLGLVLALNLLLATMARADATPPPNLFPTDVEQCKSEGWRLYGDLFKNQGDCVSFVVTDGSNQPDGPAIH